MTETPKTKTPLITYDECKENFFECKMYIHDIIMEYWKSITDYRLYDIPQVEEQRLRKIADEVLSLADFTLSYANTLPAIRLILLSIEIVFDALLELTKNNELEEIFKEVYEWSNNQYKALSNKRDYP